MSDTASERYRKIFQYSNDAVMIVDFETESFVDVNPAACELLSYDRAELLALDPDDIHPEDMDQIREEFIEQVYAEGHGWTDEMRCITKHGETVPTEASGAVLEPEDGSEPTRMVAILHDISERIEKERELERQVERLERFGETLSHDLRNPLSVLDGRLELARETGEAEHFEAMADAIETMDELIESVLSLSRHGSVIDDREDVDLARLASDTWDSTRTPNASLRVEVDCAVRADPDRLEELLGNLFRNALDHGPADVMVTVEEIADGFRVTDDEPGIDPEEREAVFAWGYSNAESGTGFGLAIVEDIAAAHGWDVTATENSAGGAAFEIRGVEFVRK
jgi:PAS domain S-box-containing protein